MIMGLFISFLREATILDCLDGCFYVILVLLCEVLYPTEE